MTNRARIAIASLVTATAFMLANSSAATADLAGLCPVCGGNSATVGDKIVFDELNVNPSVSRPGHPKIVNAKLPIGGVSTNVQLRVSGHKLSAVTPTGSYSGAALVGLTIGLKMDDGRAYEVQIVKACVSVDNTCKPMRFWVSPYTEIPSYEFKVKKTARRSEVTDPHAPDREGDDREVEDDFQEHLCKGAFRESDQEWDGLKHWGFAFEGDHYDRPKVVTTPGSEEGWFNLACYGAAVAKMHLLRHTKAGSIPSGETQRTTTLAQRATMLKAITADYCGTGKAWTADGTPLAWTDKRRWFPTPALDLSDSTRKRAIEAVWNERGALCLNVPRRQPKEPAPVYVSPPDGGVPACSPPAVTRAEVVRACARVRRKIPRCGREWLKLFKANVPDDVAYVVTVNQEKDANYCDWPATASP